MYQFSEIHIPNNLTKISATGLVHVYDPIFTPATVFCPSPHIHCTTKQLLEARKGIKVHLVPNCKPSLSILYKVRD